MMKIRFKDLIEKRCFFNYRLSEFEIRRLIEIKEKKVNGF